MRERVGGMKLGSESPGFWGGVCGPGRMAQWEPGTKEESVLKTSKEGRGWRQGGEITQALYAHMNNNKKKTSKEERGGAQKCLQPKCLIPRLYPSSGNDQKTQ
jgi:hypothetical protein